MSIYKLKYFLLFPLISLCYHYEKLELIWDVTYQDEKIIKTVIMKDPKFKFTEYYCEGVDIKNNTLHLTPARIMTE